MEIKKYIIATPENPTHFTSAAYLIEVKNVRIPPMIAQFSNKENESLRLRAFEVVKVLRKATDGTSSLNIDDFNKVCAKHREEKLYEEASSKHSKIHFRTKLSKDDQKCLTPGSVFLAPNVLSNLVFSEMDEKRAIDFFEHVVTSKYIGPLNNNISISGGYFINSEKFLVGRNTNKDSKKSFSNKELIYACYSAGDGYYLGVDSRIDFNLYSMTNKFQAKSDLYLYCMDRNIESFQKLYDMAYKYNNNFSGFKLTTVHFKDFKNMPLPIFKWDDYFTMKSNLKLEDFIFSDIEDFLFNEQNFIVPKGDFLHDMKSTIPFLSDDISIIDGFDANYKGPLKEYLIEKFNNKEKK